MIYLLRTPPAQIIITTANNNACDFFSLPDAIGLLRFVGCFRSFSKSIIFIDDVFASGEHAEDGEGGNNVSPFLEIQKIHREYDADK